MKSTSHPRRSRPCSPAEAGFTLIELVVVLTVIAVLAAIALPRFMNLQRDARIGHLQGVRGSVASSSMLVHSVLLARRNVVDSAPCPAATGFTADNLVVGAGTVCTENGIVHTQNAYPAATGLGVPGIVSMAGIGGSFNPTVSDLANDGYAIVSGAGVTTIQRVDAPIPAECAFSYFEAPQPSTAATVSSTVTTGC